MMAVKAKPTVPALASQAIAGNARETELRLRSDYLAEVEAIMADDGG